ncbi:ABC transporter substrate-binding protein [Roseococcus pinisoli]|uniref:ABC transporter substrate-binding protein n=1 Tax=Roseococcus pinisoli TaxID=2835040 RepID=A0ABS5QJF3_9PROT|nr:ABC transporter substrate-binding protein [Roseococcus pinisoli]MBS7813628.1 ABC transporter substrate-binding protein [Roseococcus pinisoli]
MTRLTRRLLLGALPGGAGLAAARPVEHALGVTEVPGTPRRVATLDNRHTENLLALGLPPVGAAGLRRYRQIMAGVEPAPGPEVTDLGQADTPNIELLLALAPELIIGNARSVQRHHAALSSIAPVLAYDPYPPGGANLYDAMLVHFRAIAEVLGRQAEAEAFLAALDAGYAAGRARLAAAGFAGRRVVLGNVNAGITGADVMLFNANALPAEILRRLGFDYAYDEPRHAGRGFNVTTAEALPALQEADFLYLPFNETGVRNLMATPIWRNLAFVREGRARAIPYREMYGSVLTAQVFARQVVAELAP